MSFEPPVPLRPDPRITEHVPTTISWDYPAERRQRFRNRTWIHVVLFLLTLATTTLAGARHYLAFLSDFVLRPASLSPAELLAGGTWYSATILGILGAHELGHYLACRYYGVNASLPYFVPAPAGLLLFGTLGAFIRIREPIRTKPMLFDIGVAGPIAGFLVAVPTLFAGLSLSRVVRVPPDITGLLLGEPLLFQAASWLIWGPVPEGYSLNLHPMAFAAWFGLFATAFNLLPIGQLDGGHISYAVLGRRSTLVTIAMIGVSVVLTFVSWSWLLPTVLFVTMLIFFGARHPRTIDEEIPLDHPRLWLAAAALGMFALCFTPTPIEPLDLLGR